MKKLINASENVVAEALHGFAAAHGDLVKVQFSPNFIHRADAPVRNKVAVISGGGSGHEPMHGGFVGKGDAGRGVSRSGVYQSHTRPDARGHESRRWRQGHAAHRQELYG
jgi:dihydroxyacetone kinase